MARAGRFDRTIFLIALAGAVLGTAVAVALLLWVVPGAKDYRPAVLSTITIPLGCFLAWILSPSRERAPTAAVVCCGLYFLSAFAAARLCTLVSGWRYYPTLVGVQGFAGLALALFLGFAGRGLQQVERLRDARDAAGLSALLRQGSPPERMEAVRALASFGEEEARPALLVALDDEDPRVRRGALEALVGSATEADVPRLAQLLRSDDLGVRRRALEALRWVGTGAAREAVAGHWRRVLASEGRRVWLSVLPMLLGALLLLVSLVLPWGSAGGSSGRRLWQIGGLGAVCALLLAACALLPLVELLWGVGRRNLEGHLDRARLWAFLPLGVLLLALFGPLRGLTVLQSQGWAALWLAFRIALLGAALEIGGSWFFRG